MQLLIQLNREEQVAVVIITHDPLVSMQCRRRALIRDGVLFEDGVRFRGRRGVRNPVRGSRIIAGSPGDPVRQRCSAGAGR